MHELQSQSQLVLAVLSGSEGNAVNSGEPGDAASVEDSECEDPGFMYPALVIVQAAHAAVKEQTSRLKNSDNKQSKTKKTNSKINNVVEINVEQSKVDEMQISNVKRSNLNESNVEQSIVDLRINLM